MLRANLLDSPASSLIGEQEWTGNGNGNSNGAIKGIRWIVVELTASPCPYLRVIELADKKSTLFR